MNNGKGIDMEQDTELSRKEALRRERESAISSDDPRFEEDDTPVSGSVAMQHAVYNERILNDLDEDDEYNQEHPVPYSNDFDEVIGSETPYEESLGAQQAHHRRSRLKRAGLGAARTIAAVVCSLVLIAAIVLIVLYMTAPEQTTALLTDPDSPFRENPVERLKELGVVE